MILPEWCACGFSKLEHVIKNEFKVLPTKCVYQLILGPGKGTADAGSRLLHCSIFVILCWCTYHLMSYALNGGKLLVPTLWNWLRAHCYASRPDAETRSCIVFTLRILFIDGDTASYLCSSELLKIWRCVRDICTHLLKCYLNCVRNELKRNSAVPMCLLEGYGSNYIHWWRLKEQKFYASETISKLI